MADEKISGLSQFAAVALNDEWVGLDVSDHSMGSHGTDKWATVSQIFTDTVAWRFPNASDDTAQLNEVIANGGACQLVQATLATQPYIVSSPLLPATGSSLRGAQAWSASANDAYSGAGGGASGGTTIFATGFAGAAIISMVNSTGTQYYGAELADFCIEGFSTGGSGAYGLLAQGAWGACNMHGVCFHRPDQHCALFQVDGSSGYVPDEWIIDSCKFSASRNGGGLIALNLPDSVISNSNWSENATSQSYWGFCTNTKVNGCKGENGGGTTQSAFHIGGMSAGETLELNDCSSNLNPADAILLDDTSGGSTAVITISNFRSSSDGQVTAGSAAIRNNGCKAVVKVDGVTVVPNGTGPAYGAWYGGSAHQMKITGASLSALTAPWLDDGSNDTPLFVQQAGLFTGAVAPGIVTLTDAATILVNAAKGNKFSVTLGGNRTMGAPSNATDGQQISFRITQDGTGTRLLTWTSGSGGYSFGGGSAPTLSTGAGALDIIVFEWVAAKSRWCYLGPAQGF